MANDDMEFDGSEDDLITNPKVISTKKSHSIGHPDAILGAVPKIPESRRRRSRRRTGSLLACILMVFICHSSFLYQNYLIFNA